MKKIFIYFSILLGAFAAVSCNKAEQPLYYDEPTEIVFNLGTGDDFHLDVDTKATAITSIPASLYWGATTGTKGASGEAVKWSAASASVSSSSIATGQYQNATPVTYNFYLMNANFTVAADGGTAISNLQNTTDYIYGVATSNATPVAVTLNHVFARTGTLTMNTQSGYTISGVSWTIIGKSTVNGTKGTFNLASGSWTAAATKLTSATAITSSSDMYLIPGTYTIACTYTLTKGDWSQTFTKSADVTLQMGKINNITGTATGGAASEISLNLTLTAWGSQSHTPVFE